MNKLIIPTIQRGIEQTEGLFVLDEIGPIQLQSNSFKEKVLEVINNNRISILGIIAENDDEFIKKIKLHYRSELIKVTKQNKDDLINHVSKEFI